MCVSLMTVEGKHHRNFRIDDQNCSFGSPGCVSLMTVEEKHNRNSIWACQAIPQASPQTSPQASLQASPQARSLAAAPIVLRRISHPRSYQ